MIDRDQRLLADEGDRLGGREPHDDTADQARSCGGGDAVEAGEAYACICHRLGDHDIERLHMRARRDLRHDAAEGGVRVDLREHDVGENPPRPLRKPLDDRRAGLVARRFDAEHEHLTSHPRVKPGFR